MALKWTILLKSLEMAEYSIQATAFETLKKSLQSAFLEAQIIFKCLMALIFCSMYFWEPKLHSQNLFDTNKTRQKIFTWL